MAREPMVSPTLSVRQPLVVLIKGKQPDVVLLQQLGELRRIVGPFLDLLVFHFLRASCPPSWEYTEISV